MNNTIYTVTQVNLLIKSIIDETQLLQGIFVSGELSNYKMYPSGHCYFTLKDEEGTLSCVMFKRSASRLKFKPENGMKIVLLGNISVYNRDGKYQLICEQMIPDGIGELQIAFEQLSARLKAEGLFDIGHKKLLPMYPERIALITSASGDAVHDLIRILKHRWPLAKILVMGVRVQGKEAPAELRGAIRYADFWKLADVIIIGRGGGSAEDLWGFNDERLARAIYECEIPVISAVGHEPDFVITDYVADRRASTPSNAAEIAVPDTEDVEANIGALQTRITKCITERLALNRIALNKYLSNKYLSDPGVYLRDREQYLDQLTSRLNRGIRYVLLNKRNDLSTEAAALDAMSPVKVLARGYSITTSKSGKVIFSVKQVEDGDTIAVRVTDGALECSVLERKEN